MKYGQKNENWLSGETEYIKLSMLEPPEGSLSKFSIECYKKKLIDDAFQSSKLDRIIETNSSGNLSYCCSDSRGKLGSMMISENKIRGTLLLSIDDRLYDKVKIDDMNASNYTMDEFCRQEYSSLEELLITVRRMLKCI